MAGSPDLDACTVALASSFDGTTGRTWVHLLPIGDFAGRDGRGPYRLDSADVVMASSREHAGRRAIPVDYEHQIDHAEKNGQPAPAAGWITGLQSRTDGIWGLVDWTPRAAEHLARREYRYLSPVFHHTRDGRVTRILRAALTNNPNLDQLTALASMETSMDPANDGLDELRSLLELPAEAAPPAILAKVRDLLTARQSAAPDPAAFVPIGDFQRVTAELMRVNQGVSLQAAQSTVEDQITAGRMPPFLREWGVALCTANKPAFDAFIAKTGPNVRRLFEPGPAAKPFRAAGEPGSDLSDEERLVSAALGHTHDEFRTRGRS